MQLFISYSRKDFPTVDRLRNDLRDVGIDVWIDKVGLTPGTLSWEQALRDAIANADAILLCASDDARKSPYVRDEVALAKQAGKPLYPAWVAGDNWLDCVPLGLGGTQYADLRKDAYTTGLMQLVAALRGEATEVEPLQSDTPILKNEPPAEDFTPRNPYKGLRAFRQEDSGDFFGREQLVGDLIAAVEDKKRPARMLGVLGASGSGKSSVMMAGLLPELQEKYPDWVYLDPIVPSANPLEKLTIALARQFENKSQSAIREDLIDGSTRGLHRLACEIGDGPVVLYIDQFEEVFTLVDNEAERRRFIDLLSTAVTEPDGVLYLLLSMRADFYDRPLQFTPFGKLVETHHIAITPMSLADLYDVVQKPAALPNVRLNFEDGLVTEMVFAVREETAALPLLQFTLDQLFEERDGATLTLDTYHEMGGIQGGLTRHADATYSRLPSEQHRTMARALFLRLIEPGQTEQDTTRRRASYSELTLPDVEQSRILQETADAFVTARLLVSDQSGETRTLEVSHEALIREWGKLGEWLHNAREDLRLQKSLSADVAEWKRRRQPTDMLYRGTVLAEALDWMARNSASRDETAFLSISQEHQTDREKSEAKSRRNLRFALAGLAAVIVLASVGLVLIFARNNAALQDEAAILQAEAATLESIAVTSEYRNAYAQAQVNFAATRQFGISPFDITQTPAAAFATTATAYAELVAWEPVTQTFEGIEMVLVPAGCFYMGSNENRDEQPIHEICFHEPFWIDKYEVTNADYGSIGCEQWSSEPDQPRNCVDWFEASHYCQARSARLPTEAEWEYAARGPDGLVYPWGNAYDAALVIGRDDPTYGDTRTAPVGSRPGGASWVDALDMSGNLWEWTSSLDEDYPYSDDHESNSDISRWRALRGGSFNTITSALRSAYRDGGNPDGDGNLIGFRCARSYQ